MHDKFVMTARDSKNLTGFVVRCLNNLPILLTLIFSLIISRNAGAQTKLLPDHKATEQTLRTETKIHYNHKSRFKRKYFVPKRYNEYDYIDAHSEVYRYYDEKHHTIVDYFVGEPFITYFKTIPYRIMSFYDKEKESDISFYGLKSSEDGQQLVPTVYTAIFYQDNKEVYVLWKWDKAALYFRKQNRLTETCWDQINCNPVTDMIILHRGDSAALMDYSGNLKIGLRKHDIVMDDFGAILKNDSGLVYLDSNFHRHPLNGCVQAETFRYGIGMVRPEKNSHGGHYINLDGETITADYKVIFPFHEEVGRVCDSLGRWALIGRDGKPRTEFAFDMITYNSLNSGSDYESSLYHNYGEVNEAPVIARRKGRYYFYDTRGNLLLQQPVDYFSFLPRLYNVGIIARKNENGKLMYGLFNNRMQELMPMDYAEISFNKADTLNGTDKFDVLLKDAKGQTQIISVDELKLIQRK